jgi:hypothetical protein
MNDDDQGFRSYQHEECQENTRIYETEQERKLREAREFLGERHLLAKPLGRLVTPRWN